MTDHAAAHKKLGLVIDAMEDDLIALRRDLHTHPEPSWEEHRTTAILLDRLRLAGLDATPTPMGTGVICDIGSGGPVVAIRGDIDALRMPDAKDVSYRSVVDGVCHACGHDLHAAAALGAGLALAGTHDDLAVPGTVRLILQPAEETVPGGAVSLVEAGCLDGVQGVFGLHADPSQPVGRVGLSVGPITSAADMLSITLTGPGGHTGRPHETADLVHIASRLVIDLPSLLGRLCDPRSGLNLTFGAINAGQAPNVIPTDAVIRGSLRASGRSAWDDAPRHLPGLIAGIVEPLGATWDLDYQRGAPPVENDPWAIDCLAAAAEAVVGAEGIGPTAQSAGGEDFSWYGEVAPLGFARLGVHRRDTERLDLHRASFDLDERAIAIGARLLAGAALEALHSLG